MSPDPSPPFTDYPKLVTIRRFRDVPDALLAKSVLESAEIECFLADDIVVRMNWFWSYAVGQIKVRVRDSDAAASDEILNANKKPPESIDFGAAAVYEQSRCPNCQSFDLWHDELARAAYITLLIFWFFSFIPAIPFRRTGWRCRNCDSFFSES